MEVENHKLDLSKLMVLSYSRSQGHFHIESASKYIQGSIIDIESDRLITCDYRAIGFYYTNEERVRLENKFKENNFKKMSIHFINSFRGFRIW